LELQKFADETGLSLSVCQFPSGTSKWNQIEHRLFSFISSNWRGEPLRDHETIVNLDRRKYPTGRRVTDQEMQQVNRQPIRFTANGTMSFGRTPGFTDESFI
jgi:hypothetical protein